MSKRVWAFQCTANFLDVIEYHGYFFLVISDGHHSATSCPFAYSVSTKSETTHCEMALNDEGKKKECVLMELLRCYFKDTVAPPALQNNLSTTEYPKMMYGEIASA